MASETEWVVDQTEKEAVFPGAFGWDSEKRAEALLASLSEIPPCAGISMRRDDQPSSGNCL
jgi:hypothetical protein